jgi:L-asparaginase
MRTIAVLGTGGTIATRTDAEGVTRAMDTGSRLLAGVRTASDVTVRARDVFIKNSFLLTSEDMVQLAHEVRGVLLDSSVHGVVITHGTDTMEETAYLLDMVQTDDRPVVLTGAQRAADAPDSDGPRNLADAIAVAADTKARGFGVLIVFDGQVYAARGTRKTHTLRPGAFDTPDGSLVGHVIAGRFVLQSAPMRNKPLALDTLDLRGVRVDIAAVYPDADSAALRAFREAGATGIVLEATGAGNANPKIAEEVADLASSGVVVGLSTRVDSGPVAALYGDGGGIDLLDAGAVPLGTLRAPQGRILLTALLGSMRDPARVRAEIPRFIKI